MSENPKNSKFIVLIILFLFFCLMIAFRYNSGKFSYLHPLIGKSAPLFSVKTLSNDLFNLENYITKKLPIILNFWMVECTSCQAEASELQRFYLRTLQDTKKATFVSINVQDSTKSILEFQKNFKISYPVLLDTKNEIASTYGVIAVPETYFISSKGILRQKISGEVDVETLERTLELTEVE